MAISKVILNGNTLMDVTQDTVTSATLVSGETATKADGTSITGSLTLTPRTSADLTANGATVTAPSGYYAENATKTIASGSATTPYTSISAIPTISLTTGGLISAEVDITTSVTPTVSAGYVSSGTAGTVKVSGTGARQLQTVPSTNYTPTAIDQIIIPSGRYTTGPQMILGDPFLTPENIKKGVTIFGVTGIYGGGVAEYSVTVNLTNPYHPSSFGGCTIYTALSNDYYDVGRTIGTISSPTGSTTVSVPTDVYGIIVIVSGTAVSTGYSYGTGDVSYISGDGSGSELFQVTGDGTATLDGVDYSD